MSTETPIGPETTIGTLPKPDTEYHRGPEPVSHGSRMMNVFNDVDVDLEPDGCGPDATTYDAVYQLRQALHNGGAEEPYVVATLEGGDVEGLPPARSDREYILELTSSGWRAGSGEGDDYSQYYEYNIKLRERDDDGDTYKPPLALSVDIQPQDPDLVNPDGKPLETPYGAGSRVLIATTWADSPDVIETRLLDVLELALGVDRDALEHARNPDSRRIMKAEAHVRFDIAYKNAVVETLEQSKQLIAYGGDSKIDAHQKRQREGWLEAVVDAERWWLLGFPREDYDIKTKVYQSSNWADTDPSNPFHHPKLEASYSGARGDNSHPHASEWDDVLGTLREVVSSHLEWAGVDREQLVADDFQDGSALPQYKYEHPVGRREQLKERYENVATEIYREATKASTTAVYDLLRSVAVESGASYDTLEDRTGLARSTIRYHVKRLEDAGVVSRVGNPVLVVFPTLAILEQAEDILRRIYPEDQLEDIQERAEQRREDREQRDDPDDVDAGDQDDDQDDVDDDRDDDAEETWLPFDELALEPHQLANALESDYVEQPHVRVRTDPYGSWIGD